MVGPTVVVDLFAGAGGLSTGIAQECKALGRKIDLLAINHWPEAVATHEANHPWARHILDDVRSVNPLEVIPGGHVHLLAGAPECTWYSRAAGGKPRTDQNRASAWDVLRWPELLRVDSMLMENVPDFMGWGPRDSRGRIIKSRRGETFQAFVHVIRSMGYNVDYRVLNAADYGAATSRSRLFLLARKGNKPIVWPEPTHSKTGHGRKKWKSARSVIDWSLKGKSISNRERPLAENTVRRIMEGFKRFGGAPYLVLMENGGGVGDLSDPLKTITTAHGGSMALTEPIPSIQNSGPIALVEPFVLSQASGGAPRSVGDPLPTIVGQGRGNMLVEPFIIPYFGEADGQVPRSHSVGDPLPAVTSHGAGALVQPFILPVEGYYHLEGQNAAKSIDEPLGAITQRGGGSIVEPYLIKYFGRGKGPRSVEEPLDTLTTKQRYGLAQPYLVRLNGTDPGHIDGSARSVEAPLDTIVGTGNHFGLVVPTSKGDYIVDFLFRMLQPHELAAATGFPKGYIFKGTKTDTVKQIGNAVVVNVARALARSLLSPTPAGRLDS